MGEGGGRLDGNRSPRPNTNSTPAQNHTIIITINQNHDYVTNNGYVCIPQVHSSVSASRKTLFG